MSELVADKVQTTKKVVPEKVIIKVANVVETAWVLEGTEKKDPVRMSWPGLYRIIPTSKVKDPKGGPGFINIRHVSGCDSIIPKEQDQQGYVANIENDNIYIINGVLQITREGSTVGAYDYVKNYQGNGDNPNRPPEAEIEFVEVKEGEILKQKVVDFDTMREAMEILGSFRTRTEIGYVYNEELLNKIAPVFDLHLLESLDDKFVKLSEMAMQDPDKFIHSVANPKKDVIATVKLAEKFGALVFTDDQAMLKDGPVIVVYKTKMNKATKINKLVDVLLTADGKIFLEQLKIASEKAGEESLNTVN